MRLAASNIGWAPEQLDQVLPRLADHSVEGLVIAPTMVWQGAPDVTEQQARDFRLRVEDSGLVVAGMQSLTFGLENASLSGDEESRRRLAEHLRRHAELAGRLGAGSLIFGSPGLRKDVNEELALEVFSAAAEAAADNETRFCIEPLSGYGNKFITTTADGVKLTERMHHLGYESGFGLHLDSAAIAGQRGTRPDLDITAADTIVGIHSFDASAPDLLPLSHEGSVPHREMADALRLVQYAGFVSLEMRQPQGVDDPVRAFFNEVDFVRDTYSTTR